MATIELKLSRDSAETSWGLTFGLHQHGLYVIDAVNPQTPAWTANVTAGSTLVSVNGVATKGAEMADILSQCTTPDLELNLSLIKKSTQSMGSTFGCIDKMMISMGLQAPRQAPASSQPASPASPPSYNASAVSAPGLQVAEFCGQCGAPVTAPFCGGCGTATGFSNSPTEEFEGFGGQVVTNKAQPVPQVFYQAPHQQQQPQNIVITNVNKNNNSSSGCCSCCCGCCVTAFACCVCCT